MTCKSSEPTDFIATAAGWSAKRILVGRIVLEEVSVATHEGALHLNSALVTLLEKTRRPRTGQSRFAEPLPLGAPARLLSKEAADFLEDMKRRGLAPSTISTQKHVFRLLTLAAGDIPASEVNAQHIREFWDVVRWWPERAGTKRKFRHMSDQEILAAGKASNRAPPAGETHNSLQGFLATFFNRLLRMRVISHSPLEAYGEIRSDLVDHDRRRPFNEDELRRVFDHETFIKWGRHFPHRWWCPMLALYTGARASEIAQLKIADVIVEKGIPCIALRKTIDEDLVGEAVRTRQRLKGRSSIRTIPIAQPIIDAGFLEFVEDAKATKHARLFPHLPSGVSRKTGKPNGNGYGAAIVAQFSRFLKLEHQMEKGLVFHSFRHLFISSLEEAGVPVERIASITGHTIKQTVPVLQEHYVHKQAETVRQRQVEDMAKFRPGVHLPRYRRGQFSAAYRKDARMYP